MRQAIRHGSLDLVEVDLAAYGASETAKQWRLFVRPLRFAEALRLQQWIARTVGTSIAGAISAAAVAADPESRREAMAGELAATLPLLVDALAALEDWYDLLVARARGVAFVVSKMADPSVAGAVQSLDEATLEEVFSEASGGVPGEALCVLYALIAEGVGPLPGLGSLRRGAPR